ncbi:undecaprenyl/decaprenyl-phosphate alpha-N-acetylglucosaminyl 1-phosphate transferase [bacterium]|nr:undecaprenyl/decaprenyl-phosphate alpha-N-acetylglucosaminyl 1-phosphate transferase [bacterium]
MSILLAFVLSFFVALILTPIMRIVAVKTGIMDRPDARKVHRKPVPYLGGVAIFGGFFAAGFLARPDLHSSVLTIMLGAFLVLVLGVADDAFNMRASLKLFGQLSIATVTYLMGVSIPYITHPFGGVVYTGILEYPLTVVWIVSMMNTVNLIDGLDGLAGGICAISGMFITIIALQTGQWPAAMLSMGIVGGALGFLRYNFSPASIFMGDAGSMFLGYALATATMIGVLKSAFTISIAIPILVLAIPIFDTAFAIIRRLRAGKPIFSPDKFHFHHQLLAAGLSPKEAVILVYAASFLLGLVALLLGYLEGITAVSLLFVTGVVVFGILRYFKTNLDRIRALVFLIHSGE